MHEHFFDLIWGDVEGEVLITSKQYLEGKGGANKWFTWPKDRDDLNEYVDRNLTEDLYFTTTTYTQRSRQAEYAKSGSVVYADADTCPPNAFRLAPTATVRTSPGHWQVYWVLDDVHSAGEVAQASRKVARAHKDQGCDAGWIVTKLLRVPGSMHTKGTPVQVTYEVSGELYSMADILQAYSDVQVGADSVAQASPIPADLPDLMTLTERLEGPLWSLFSGPFPPGIELSSKLWRFECDLFREGFTPAEVFVAARASAVNKYAPSRVGEVTSSGGTRPHRADPDGDLWKEVQQAALKWQDTSVVEDDNPPAPLTIKPEADYSFLSQDERDYVNSHPTFVTRYTDWVASRSNAAPAYSRTLGYVALACAFGGKAFVPLQHGNVRLNLYAMILGETTLTRKSTALNMFKSVVHEIEQQNGGQRIDIGSDFSGEALNKTLGERHGQTTLVWKDEVQGFFKEMFTKNYMSGLAERLTDLYEGSVQVSMRTAKGASQSKRANVPFNMVLMGIEREAGEVLTDKNFQSGFLTRFLWSIAKAPKLTRDLIDIKVRNDSHTYTGVDPQATKFAKELFSIAKAIPEGFIIYPTDEALARINDFQWTITQLAMNTRNPENMAPTTQRLANNVLKCAALLALHDRAKEIELKHVLPVVAQAEEWYAALEHMSDSIAASEFAKQADEIEQYIAQRGGSVKLAEVYRKFARERLQQVNEYIDSLVHQNRVIKAGQTLKIRGAAQQE